MNERDDELLKLYGHLPREMPPAALDASILAASRRATRKPLARWAAPVSVAAVLVLALGLVLKVQREAPEATMPSQSSGAPAAPVPAAPGAQPEASPAAAAPGAQPEALPAAAAPAQSALRDEASGAANAPRVQAPRREAPLERRAPAPRVESATTAQREKKQAQAPRFAPEPPAIEQAPASSADLAPARAQPAPAAAGAAPASRAQSARVAAAPVAAEKAKDSDPLLRELERIAELRAHGKDDEADAALEAFRRAHPDYRIEPATWEKVRRR